MRAMVLSSPGSPLQLVDLPTPIPKADEVLIRVEACGVCRTDLHLLLGELQPPHFPLVLGHQAVGKIVAMGKECHHFAIGDLVGAPWLAQTCHQCPYCLKGQENLCDRAVFRGYQINGGFAEYCVAHEDYLFPIPAQYTAVEAAPFLCGGLIGFRALRMAGEAPTLGFYGFGSSAHLLTQVANYQGQKVYAFTRPGDHQGETFARSLGAVWAGGSDQQPPEKLDAAIIFASDGNLVPEALKAVKKGGQVICAGIHMTDIPSFSYDLIYGEREIRSVTNLTRQDGLDFFKIAQETTLKAHVTLYPLEQANQALQDLKEGRFHGSAVLTINHV